MQMLLKRDICTLESGAGKGDEPEKEMKLRWTKDRIQNQQRTADAETERTVQGFLVMRRVNES
jgi:hypothetical protein